MICMDIRLGVGLKSVQNQGLILQHYLYNYYTLLEHYSKDSIRR